MSFSARNGLYNLGTFIAGMNLAYTITDRDAHGVIASIFLAVGCIYFGTRNAIDAGAENGRRRSADRG